MSKQYKSNWPRACIWKRSQELFVCCGSSCLTKIVWNFDDSFEANDPLNQTKIVNTVFLDQKNFRLSEYFWDYRAILFYQTAYFSVIWIQYFVAICICKTIMKILKMKILTSFDFELSFAILLDLYWLTSKVASMFILHWKIDFEV